MISASGKRALDGKAVELSIDASLVTRWTLAFAALLSMAFPATATEVLDQCAAREVADESRAPRTVTLGDPPRLSVSVPEGWSIDLRSLRLLDDGVPLERVEAHLRDTDCGTASSAALSVDFPARCRSTADPSACWAVEAMGWPEGTTASTRLLDLEAGRTLEIVGEGTEILHLVDGEPAVQPFVFHRFLVGTADGIVACMLTVDTSRYEEFRSSVQEFCQSIRLR
jgi:hypothetical protein